jgi:outer membrane receptor protein involved in Fe transport
VVDSPALAIRPRRSGRVARWAVSIALLAWSVLDRAQARQPEPQQEPDAATNSQPPSEPQPVLVTVVGVTGSRGSAPGRASSRVSRQDLTERLPRSAPDALRYEPGVYVQQSGHGQGSPYIRGRTGQQTLVLFDGIRINTSTWRQGPNQYFFTLDSRWLHSIEVIRGGASTVHGSDAIAGVIDVHPIEPELDLQADGARVRPRAALRWASADSDFLNRFELDTQFSRELRWRAGASHRDVGRLRSGGRVKSPEDGSTPQVPAFESDGRTQLGTGFEEWTFDNRLVAATGPSTRFVAAAYAYRQLDSPRTDQCPPPYAPRNECLNYDEQFRSLAYVAHQGRLGQAAERSRLAISYQRQHERRTLDRPGSFVKNGGRDDVDTLGFTGQFATEPIDLAVGTSARLQYGADVFHDWVSSAAWTEFTDIEAVIPLSRGQYLDASRYLTLGAFAQGELSLGEHVVTRAGARLGGARANAPGDTQSGSASVDAAWTSLVGNVGVEWRLTPALTLLGSWDRSFRAPNLDDLTSRQQSGPGFQFENPYLEPELADTFEAGVRVTHRQFELDAFAYRSIVHDAIARALRTAEDCPPSTPQCALSWSRFQLVNLAGDAVIDGFELSGRASIGRELSLRATLSYAYGVGPNPGEAPSDPSVAFAERVPLSRIPPLNGTLEARWSLWLDAYVGLGLRWATLQDRLAPTDRSDERIPRGGTPGFAVLDARAGWRMGRELVLSVVTENLTDAAYRYHGSSVNGPGRGVIFSLEAGL